MKEERAAATAFPLAWPAGWRRTMDGLRGLSRFAKGPRAASLTPYSGAQEVLRELALLGARLPVISTNLRTRNDGIPLSGQKRPADPGVAVYFTLQSGERVLACDCWTTVEDNLRAIAKHINAIRGMQRWGVGSIEQAFRGFTALPEAVGSSWRAVLAFHSEERPSPEQIQSRFREFAKRLHPDLEGGDAARMAELNVAREEALKEAASW